MRLLHRKKANEQKTLFTPNSKVIPPNMHPKSSKFYLQGIPQKPCTTLYVCCISRSAISNLTYMIFYGPWLGPCQRLLIDARFPQNTYHPKIRQQIEWNGINKELINSTSSKWYRLQLMFMSDFYNKSQTGVGYEQTHVIDKNKYKTRVIFRSCS